MSRRNDDESHPDRATFAPGDYGRVTRPDGTEQWYVRSPKGTWIALRHQRVFSAIGILATTRAVARGRDRRAARKPWVVLAACLALLALLGTSPDVDILAHLFGLLVGGVLGLATGLALPSAPRPSVQWMLAIRPRGAGRLLALRFLLTPQLPAQDLRRAWLTTRPLKVGR